MSKDYKDSLLMMKTDFNMRANLPNKEPEIQQYWEEIKLYQKRLEKNKSNKSYTLHDGPPYANGDIHIGHALNKILKDFIVRYKSMEGYHSVYISGWDTHGLPIETALSKSKKVNRKELSVPEFRSLCKEYALEQVERQKLGFKRLGVLGDFENPYITLDGKYEAKQLEIFAKMVEEGLIYKGLKPVFWSPSSETALAEAEIEYQDVKSPSIYLAFKVKDGKGVLEKDDYLVIWTTTPWTIPANLAVCVNEKYDYQLIKIDGKKLVVAKELAKAFSHYVFDDKPYTVLKEVKGKDLEYITYLHPLNGKECPVILGDHVTLESGTGLVHTAPGHGEDDFIVGKVYNLDVLCPVDEKGYMTSDAFEFEGLFYEDANKHITKRLEEVGSLLKLSFITHSYPHDWRTKKPIIFRATDQWFASIDKIKDDLLKAVEKVNWHPKWGELRISNMIKDRKEWCISRQRVWGVPIPVFYCEDKTPILDSKVILHVASIFEKEGSNAWFLREAKDLLPKGYKNPKSPNGIFTKEMDTMDVWFDSGSSHHAVLGPNGLKYPADLYIEGSDQYRGWFNSSLITGVSYYKEAPYKEVISHGFVLAGDEKMSKSLGNVIKPDDVCNKYGADILRLWVASVDYTADVSLTDELLVQVSENYRKIRNTFRFLLGNLFDYDNNKNKVKYEDLGETDQYIIVRLNQLIKDVRCAYDEYDFATVYHLVLNYMTNILSSFYLDYSKDVVYVEAANSLLRRRMQTVFYENLFTLVRLLNPILPHTTEEVYQMMSNTKEKSVYLENMPEAKEYKNAKELEEKYEKFLKLRDDVLKALEVARTNKVIGKSLVSKVVIKPTKEVKELISSLKTDLALVFIVAEFKVDDSLKEGDAYESGLICVTAKDGYKCDRCWQIKDEVDEDNLCARCAKVIKNKEE